MKGMPDNPEGSKGPLYKQINALLESARGSRTVDEVLSILGEPDKIAAGPDPGSPTIQLAELGSTFSFGDERAETVFTYVDPYRRRKRYKFGFVGDQLDSNWEEVVHESRKDEI